MRKIVDFIDIIKKIKNLNTDADVAAVLGLSKEALANHKSRETLPIKHIIDLAERENLSLNFLLSARGELDNIELVSTKDKNNFCDDMQTAEIIDYLAEHPDFKNELLDLIRATKQQESAWTKFLKHFKSLK